MLVIERSLGTSIWIGSDVQVKVLKIGRNKVRLGLEVPKGLVVWREELGERPAEELPPIGQVGVLIVEDDPVHARLVQEGFHRAGQNKIMLAGSGEDALAMLEQTVDDPPQRPGLAILDLNLPGISGLDVLKAIRGSDPFRLLPVIMLSSADDEENVQACLEAGANAFVNKTSDYRELGRTVVRMADFWAKARTV